MTTLGSFPFAAPFVPPQSQEVFYGDGLLPHRTRSFLCFPFFSPPPLSLVLFFPQLVFPKNVRLKGASLSFFFSPPPCQIVPCSPKLFFFSFPRYSNTNLLRWPFFFNGETSFFFPLILWCFLFFFFQLPPPCTFFVYSFLTPTFVPRKKKPSSSEDSSPPFFVFFFQTPLLALSAFIFPFVPTPQVGPWLL